MKRIILICLIACTIFSAMTCIGQSTQSLQLVRTEKNPGIAFALSAFLPGAGQMYNGEVKEGLFIFIVDNALLISGLTLLAYEDNSSFKDENEKTAHKWGTILLVAGAAGYLAQLIQAPLASVKWNKKNGFMAMHKRIELFAKEGGLSLCYSF